MIQNKVSDKLKYPLTYDILIKTILYRNQDLLIDLIKEILNIDINKIKVDLKSNDLFIDKINEKERKVDLQIKVNDSIIVNLEFNSGYYKDVLDRNLVYATKIRNSQIRKGKLDKWINDVKVIQINFCGKSTKQDSMEDIGYYKLEKNKELIGDNPLIIVINLDKFKKHYYNGNKEKKTALLAFFKSTTYQEGKMILKDALGENEAKKIMEEVMKIMMEDYYTLRWNTEDWYRFEGENIGLRKGEIKGEAKKEKSIILKMFEKDFDLSTISEITGVSIKKLEKIKKDFNKNNCKKNTN